MKQRSPLPARLQYLASLSRMMDSRFRIPGTNVRFGLDAIIGLIPGAGDISTFAISAGLMMIMAKNGASGYIIARMVFNVLVDAVIGMIPLLGDVFDVFYKANNRNLRLLEEHYVEGRHHGSAWKVIIPVLIILFIVIAAIVYGGYKLLAYIF